MILRIKNIPCIIFSLFSNKNGSGDTPGGVFPIASHGNDNINLGVFQTKTCFYDLKGKGGCPKSANYPNELPH